MFDDVRTFIQALGGYRLVARRLGMGTTTLHTHISNGMLPAQWFDAFCDLAREGNIAEPQRSLFSFKPLPVSETKADAA